MAYHPRFLAPVLYLVLFLTSGGPPVIRAQQLSVPEVEEVNLNGRGIGYSAPVIADLDGSVANGKELVVGGSDGRMYALTSNGEILWTVNVPGSDCGSSPVNDKLYSSPAVGDLFGDGVVYVVIGYGGFNSAECDGGIAVYRGSDGDLLWNFSIKEFAARKNFLPYRNTVFSTPALADVDNDGLLEIGFGGFDRHIYLLNGDGSVRWYHHVADTVWSSATFLNVDEDAELEMIIGADITANASLKPKTRDGGFLYAFKTHDLRGGFIPFRDPGREILIWKRSFNQVVYSSPVVGEVIPTNPGQEVVIGSGCFFPSDRLPKRGSEFRILAARTGKVLARISTPLCAASSASIGDVDGDGEPDLVLSIPSIKAFGGNGKGTVMAINPATGAMLWTTTTRAMFPFQSPLLADLDGDGAQEVIVSEATSIAIFDGSAGAVKNRTRIPGTSQATAAIDDLDGDGLLDIVAAGAQGGKAEVYFLRNLEGERSPTSESDIDSRLAWPQWRGNSLKDGRVR